MPGGCQGGIGRALSRLYVCFVCLYLLSPFGATFNGVIIPDSHPLTFSLMALSLLLWLGMRLRWGWRWHGSPLDRALPLWALAIVASLLANPQTAHRSMIGLWFILVYVGVWALLRDLAGQRAEFRTWLVDGMLAAGLMLMIFSALQALMTGNPLQIVSLLGNANALGTVLIVITCLALGRALSACGRARYAWAIYALAAGINLALTLSRGAWIGMFAALAAMLILLLRHADLLSPARFIAYLETRPARCRIKLMGGGLAAIALLMVAMALIVNSFTLPTRRARLRSEIWHSAWLQFAEKPVTGQGAFAFGFQHGRHVSAPPALHYAHAHSLPLNLAAELGALGLAAGAITLMQIGRNARRSWASLRGNERIQFISLAAAAVGFGAHNTLDVTAMMPAVALIGILILALMSPPGRGKRQPARFSQQARTALIALLWMVVLIAGISQSRVNQQYLAALRAADYGVPKRESSQKIADYQRALAMLDDVNGGQPVILQQQAMLLGLLADLGDASALDRAIASMEAFLEIEPHHAPSWANLAALHWQSGDRARALLSIERALELAPDFQLFQQNRALYAGEISRQDLVPPRDRYNQEFTRYNFLVYEALPLTFLPQVGYGDPAPLALTGLPA